MRVLGALLRRQCPISRGALTLAAIGTNLVTVPKNRQREFEELKWQIEAKRRKLRELVDRSGKRLRESDERLKSADRTLRGGPDEDPDDATH